MWTPADDIIVNIWGDFVLGAYSRPPDPNPTSGGGKMIITHAKLIFITW